MWLLAVAGAVFLVLARKPTIAERIAANPRQLDDAVSANGTHEISVGPPGVPVRVVIDGGTTIEAVNQLLRGTNIKARLINIDEKGALLDVSIPPVEYALVALRSMSVVVSAEQEPS